MTSMSDFPMSRIERLAVAELRPQKLIIRVPPGLTFQLENASRRVGLTQEQWLVAAAFEKLRREIHRQPKKPKRHNLSGDTAVISTPDFFMRILRQRNRRQKKSQR
jgi:hypothetical protein